MATDWKQKIALAVARGKQEIAGDVAAGVVPATVATFSELHDYVDANEYGGLCDDGWLEYADGEWTPETEAGANAVQDALHHWLVAGRPDAPACDVCTAGVPDGYALCPACGRLDARR